MKPQRAKKPKIFHIKSRTLKMKKEIDLLVQTDLLGASAQYVEEGGDNNLHAHPATDAVWIVIEGKATFYGERNRVIAQLGPGGVILIPRGTKYWFKKSSPKQAVVIRVWANDPNVKDERVEYAPPSEAIKALL